MHNPITNADQLQLKIKLLKEEEILKKETLREIAAETFNSLKPANLIKSGLKELTSGSKLRSNILNTAAGIGAGILGKKILIGGSKNIFKRLLGMFVQGGVTDLVANKLHPFKRTNGVSHPNERE
jgi:hypothetical protein